MARETIKDFHGEIIGSVDGGFNGDRIAKDFYGKILGRFDKRQNVTKDNYGRIIGTGDATSKLVWDAWAQRQAELKSRQTNSQ